MNLEVRRNWPTLRATTGRLLVANVPLYVTLEPPPAPDLAGNGYTCIPAGVYKLTVRWSPRFARQVPHVEGVPGRAAIELHIGNYPGDTDGCALVGTDYGSPMQPDYVSRSAVAFASLMTRLYAGSYLTNPDAAERDQVWDVGVIVYTDFKEET